MASPETDLDIVRQVAAGDVRSFKRIIDKYQGKVFRLCCAMAGEPQAEDAAQDVFIKVYESLSGFKGESSLSTWIYRIAANHCLNIISKRKRERTESLDALMEKSGGGIAPSAPGASAIDRLADKQAVQSAMERLSPEERAILTLREMEGLNYKELAETLEISQDLVKVRLFRARQSFLKAVKKLL